MHTTFRHLITILFFLSSPLFSNGFEKVCDRPEVYVCNHFLSDAECDYVIEMARPHLARATVIDPKSEKRIVDSRRTSLGTFLPTKPSDWVIQNIHRRIAEATGIPEENGEGMQILYYGIGAEYQPHFDYFDPNTAGGKIHFDRGGQRVASFLVYLNTAEEGGETIFPRAHLKIAPVKGKALLFYNVNAQSAPDPMSLHGGCPVIKGEKWLMTRWLREQAFH